MYDKWLENCIIEENISPMVTHTCGWVAGEHQYYNNNAATPGLPTLFLSTC